MSLLILCVHQEKELLKAAAKGFADNWLAAGLISDNSYATNPHTSGAKALGQGLGQRNPVYSGASASLDSWA